MLGMSSGQDGRIDQISWIGGSAPSGVIAIVLYCQVPVFGQPIQDRLDFLSGLEAPANPHDVPAVHFGQPILADGAENIFTLLSLVLT